MTRESRWLAPTMEDPPPSYDNAVHAKLEMTGSEAGAAVRDREDEATAEELGQNKRPRLQPHVRVADGAFRGPVDVLYNPSWRFPADGGVGCLCGLECEDKDELELHNPW